MVAVTHDRYFLDNVAGWILELDRGKGIPFEGNYSAWLADKDARLGAEPNPNAGGGCWDTGVGLASGVGLLPAQGALNNAP